MSPLYDDIHEFEVLFEQEGFQVSKYPGLTKPQLVHRCSVKEHSTAVAELVHKHPKTGQWKCSYCYRICPDDVITVWTLLDGVKPPIKYYSTVKFSGLAEAV
jgi:NAD-dependent dihydropyrimidine dehydrogenase PreA subunit